MYLGRPAILLQVRWIAIDRDALDCSYKKKVYELFDGKLVKAQAST
jgi:hypothetical protein